MTPLLLKFRRDSPFLSGKARHLEWVPLPSFLIVYFGHTALLGHATGSGPVVPWAWNALEASDTHTQDSLPATSLLTCLCPCSHPPLSVIHSDHLLYAETCLSGNLPPQARLIPPPSPPTPVFSHSDCMLSYRGRHYFRTSNWCIPIHLCFVHGCAFTLQRQS